MKSNTYREYIRPVVVLVIICFVVTALLAVTYSVANPIIEENTEKSNKEARQELLAEADDFTEYDGELVGLTGEESKIFVKEVYVANNGAGMVITVQTNSFGGALTMMVGIDSTGAITGVKVTDHADTPGVGTKNWDGDNRNYIYDGMTSVTSESVKGGEVEYITGASVTGNAIHKGVRCALQQFESMGGVN